MTSDNLSCDYSEPSHAEQIIQNFPKLPKEDIKALSKLKPIYSYFAIIGDWLLIICAVILSELFWLPLFYPVTALFISARFHSLTILDHDAQHFIFQKNRQLADWVCDIFTAWPGLLITTDSYRKLKHLPHHRHIGTPDDVHIMFLYDQSPKDWDFPMPARKLFCILCRKLVLAPIDTYTSLVLTSRLMLMEEQYSKLFARWGLYTTAVAIIAMNGLWLEALLYWLIPVWGVSVMAYLRTALEHCAVGGVRDISGNRTRTTITGLLGKAFFVSHNLNYHYEHHCHPSVPWYNLPQLHRLMIEKTEDPLHYISPGYLSAMAELVGLLPRKNISNRPANPSC